MKRVAAAAVFAIVMLVSVGCSNTSADLGNVGTTNIVVPTYYGNEVYYFPAIQERFGNSLVAFLARNQELEVVTIAVDDTGGYGSTVGYFVVFKKR